MSSSVCCPEMVQCNAEEGKEKEKEKEVQVSPVVTIAQYQSQMSFT